MEADPRGKCLRALLGSSGAGLALTRAGSLSATNTGQAI